MNNNVFLFLRALQLLLCIIVLGLGFNAASIWSSHIESIWGMPGTMIFCGVAGLFGVAAVLVGALFAFKGIPRNRFVVIVVDAMAILVLGGSFATAVISAQAGYATKFHCLDDVTRCENLRRKIAAEPAFVFLAALGLVGTVVLNLLERGKERSGTSASSV